MILCRIEVDLVGGKAIERTAGGKQGGALTIIVEGLLDQ